MYLVNCYLEGREGDFITAGLAFFEEALCYGANVMLDSRGKSAFTKPHSETETRT